MKDTQSLKSSLVNILKDPSEIELLMQNPGKYGMDLYKGLSVKDKQYVAFAAAAGFIAYGIYLSRQK
ncbi:hypothetical protein DXT99_14230 [Pontibacter diazotrophicus]|uniref:Uncharacterized protein n=1 Tax=Pontibacter diazotrophicus TaxID=1400979 RepID=A0A3D8LB16_9BACT|nr:hypothetical protein [Pontibacter diazotrophicus]RDV14590.1 hypothetical protein DXT99_14230 [Pontibacter diazotrophicus]